MRNLAVLALFGCLCLTGCSSDERVICERLAECELLPEGLSLSECEEDARRQVSEERLERCAECVEEESCENLQEECRSTCQPGD